MQLFVYSPAKQGTLVLFPLNILPNEKMIISIEELRKFKFHELDQMFEYIQLKPCRMDYLYQYLGDKNVVNCGKYDNDHWTSFCHLFSQPYHAFCYRFRKICG